MMGSALAAIVKRDRAVAAAGVVALSGLAWLYLARLAGGMRAMPGMEAMEMAPEPWRASDAALALAMWAVMMVAMMLPSASPMILLFITIARTRAAAGGFTHLGLFVAGYLLVWGGFSVAATAGQWALREAALLSEPAMKVAPRVGAAVLLVSGVYQVTPLKRACLARCQSPLGFLLGEWRAGAAGALRMGVRHGLFCLGCCWALMALLFAGGVMNLAWIAAITAFVLAEKLLPAPRAISWMSGAVLIVWALAVFTRAG